MIPAPSRASAPLFPGAGGAAGPVPAAGVNGRRASSSASRNWRMCTLHAMATTAPARPAAPSPSSAATTGCPALAVTDASMASPGQSKSCS